MNQLWTVLYLSILLNHKKINNGMKTTEEKQQHNEIKLINESNGMDEKNCPKGVQKTFASSHKDKNSQETCNFCKKCKCTVSFSMF